MTDESASLLLDEVQAMTQAVRANVARVIVGKLEVIDLLLVALLSDGHVLLEDVPGMGKTVMAKALAPQIERRRLRELPLACGGRWTSDRPIYFVADRELRDAVAGALPAERFWTPPCDMRDPSAISAGMPLYMKLAPTTQSISVELTYRDGSVSEIKTFRR